MGYNKWIRLAFLLHLFICSAESRVEEIAPESIIKSIQIGYGQIVDCVELYSQPALKHPLLMNHTIQMHPSYIPNDEYGDVGSKDLNSEEVRSNFECPDGSVPILRRDREFRSRRSSRKAKGLYNYGDDSSTTRKQPDVGTGKEPRYSDAMLAVQNGAPPNLSMILVGWDVNPIFYGDDHAHFEIAWVDKYSSCVNYICHGFVQQSRRVFAGLKITPVSIVDAQKYYIHVKVFKDMNSGNWWLTYGDDYHLVGYWPKELFIYMPDAADSIHWVGMVVAARGEPTPPMGSGRSPDEGDSRAAYIKNIRIVDEDNNFVVPDLKDCETRETEPNCYKLSRVSTDDAGLHFLYGGEGCHAYDVRTMCNKWEPA